MMLIDWLDLPLQLSRRSAAHRSGYRGIAKSMLAISATVVVLLAAVC